MTDLLPSLMRHQCTIVQHLPYAHTPVTRTSVHTATYPMTIVRTPVPLLTTSWSMIVTRTTVRLLPLPSLKTVAHMIVLLTPLVVPSASDQYVITDPTSYDRVRNYSIQYPDGYSIRPYYIYVIHDSVRLWHGEITHTVYCILYYDYAPD